MTDVVPDTKPQGLLARAGWWAMRIGSRLRQKPSPRTERVLLGIALLAFVGATVFAIRNFPDGRTEIRWWLLLAAGGLGMPINIVLNAWEFQVIGRFVDRRIAFGRAVKVTVVGSAANLLPIPGSTLVRMQALAQGGVRYREAFVGAAVIGIMSVGANLTLVGATQAGAASPVFVAGFIGSGVTTIAVAVGLVLSMFDRATGSRASVLALGVETLYATIAAFRLWLILLGLGIDVGLPTSFALTATGSVAAALGFFPAALGIREVLVGLVSPLVGVSIAVGLMGAVVERVFGFLVLAITSGWLLFSGGLDAFRFSDEADSEAGAGHEFEGRIAEDPEVEAGA